MYDFTRSDLQAGTPVENPSDRISEGEVITSLFALILQVSRPDFTRLISESGKFESLRNIPNSVGARTD